MFRKIYQRAAKDNDLDLKFTDPKKAKGYFILADGSKHYFNSNSPGLNGPSSMALAKDKFRCGEKLREAGINSPLTLMLPQFSQKADEGDTKENIEMLVRQALHHFIDRVGFPVFVKPNTGSEGRGVYKADNARNLSRILRNSRKINKETLVQQACIGDEFRVVVLGGQVLMAYQKVPLQIVGDGQTNIHDLLVSKIDELRSYRKMKLSASSKKIDFVLSALGYRRDDILPEGKVIQPVPNGNLAQGAYPVDRTEYIREHFAAACGQIAETLRLPWMGLDLMVEKDSNSYSVIEVNSKPGFSKYAGESEVHKKKVERVYSQCIAYANTGRVNVPHTPPKLAA